MSRSVLVGPPSGRGKASRLVKEPAADTGHVARRLNTFWGDIPQAPRPLLSLFMCILCLAGEGVSRLNAQLHGKCVNST